MDAPVYGQDTAYLLQCTHLQMAEVKGMERETRVAVLDFDGTICRGDSIVSYLMFCVRRGDAPCIQPLRAACGYISQLLLPERVSKSKQTSLSFLRGRPKSEMDALGRAFLKTYLNRHLFSDAGNELKTLHDAGYTIVIASASVTAYMDLLPEFLPVDCVLATTAEVGTDGRYTGVIGPNCRGEEKLRRIENWMHTHGVNRISRAYGDSLHDFPMLRAAEMPVTVNGSAKVLSALPNAEHRNWSVKK